MGDYTDIPRTSELLDDDLRGQIKGVFAKLTEDLEIVAIVDGAEEKSRELLSLRRCRRNLMRMDVRLPWDCTRMARTPEWHFMVFRAARR